ncbi:19568_t:CDS:2, partial [Gigaspora rosea]
DRDAVTMVQKSEKYISGDLELRGQRCCNYGPDQERLKFFVEHGRNYNETMKMMNEARELDLHDKKHILSNDQIEKAEQKIGLFTRGNALVPLTNLANMQCMQFVLEE